MAPRFAAVITGVVLGGFLAMAFVYTVLDDPSPARTVPAAVALVAMLVLQVGVIGNPKRDPSRPAGVVGLVGQVAIALLGLQFDYGWQSLFGFAGGSLLLVWRSPFRWVLFALFCLFAGLDIALSEPLEVLLVGYVTVQAVVTGLIVYGLTRLRQAALELDRTRRETADLAAARERLRLSRDLHDTVGHRLSEIALRAELARRLSDTDPDRSAADVREVVTVARAALDEVRTTARRYRAPRLPDEIGAARTTLRSLGVVTNVRIEVPEVPVEVGSVLVSVLRAAVDDLLGADDVRSCTVTVTRTGDRIALRVTDDRSRIGGTEADGNLVAAVAAVGGALSSGPPPGRADDPSGAGWVVHAEVPLPASATGPRPPDAAAPPGLGLPSAQLLLTAVLVGYALNSVQFVLYAAPPPATTVLGVAAVAVMLALQLGVTGRRAGWAGPRRAALVVQALLAAGSIVLVGDPSVGLPGFVAGSALLVLPPRLRWVAFAGTVAAVTAAQAGLVGTPDGIAYGIAATVNHGLVVYGLTRLRDLVDALQAARDDVAALAVARERLRFARDLHDLLGYGLSAIALKAELAGRLLVEDAERARHEIDDVLRIVADALDDARSVAGYQQSLDLAAEIDSVRSVLDAAGVRLRLTFDPPPGPSAIPAVPGTVLATVLREAVTNLLRHSDARHCTVALRTAGDALRLEVVNDGVRPGPPRAPGTGLGSLAARAESLGGALVAGRDGAGGFVVRVTVPATGGGPAADRFATQWEPVPVTAAR